MPWYVMTPIVAVLVLVLGGPWVFVVQGIIKAIKSKGQEGGGPYFLGYAYALAAVIMLVVHISGADYSPPGLATLFVFLAIGFSLMLLSVVVFLSTAFLCADIVSGRFPKGQPGGPILLLLLAAVGLPIFWFWLEGRLSFDLVIWVG